MFGTIRKHQTWLWVVIISLTVLSFVAFGPSGCNNPRVENAMRGEGDFGTIGGRPITREELVNAVHEVALDQFFRKQQWPDFNSTETTRLGYLRLFEIYKQKDLGIQVSTEAAAALGSRLIHNLGASSLDDVNDKLLKPVGLDVNDFDRFLRHSLGIDEMMMAAGVNGKLVTSQEAETLYRLENTDVSSFLIYFGASNYMAEVQVSHDQLRQFYTNQLANYRIPERIQVNYVKFNVTNYYQATLAALTNLDQNVDAYVLRLGTNLFRTARTPEESRVAIRSEMIREHAIVDAHRAASEFAVRLDEIKPRTAAALEKLASTNGLVVRTSAPFDREYGPKDMTVPAGFAQKAFGLTAEDAFAGPIVAEDGVYVIALKQRFDSETPTLASIELKVTEDFRYLAAIQIVKQAALKFDTTLTNGLAAGKSFSDLCLQAGVKPEALPPISLNTRAAPEDVEKRINFSLLRQVIFGTQPGKASTVVPAEAGAFVIYVDKRLPMDMVKLNTELPAFTAYVRSMRLNDAFNQWFNNEIRADAGFVQFIQKLNEQTQMKAAGARQVKS